MHSHHPGDLCLLTSSCINDHITFLDSTLVDPNPGQLAILGLLKLECQTNEWLFVIDFHQLFLFIVLLLEGIVGNFLRVG